MVANVFILIVERMAFSLGVGLRLGLCAAVKGLLFSSIIIQFFCARNFFFLAKQCQAAERGMLSKLRRRGTP